MKKTAIFLAGVAVIAAAPAHARDGQWYIGVDGGISLEDQVDVDIDEGNNNDAQTNAAFADTNIGVDAALVVGYDIGPLRLELEGGYKQNGYDSLTVIDSAILPGETVVAPGTVVQNEEDLRIFSAMVNALFEIGSDDGFQIYAGGGVGLAELEFPVEVAGVGTVVDDTENDIAYQLLAGVRYPINDKIDFGLRYRYFVIDEFELAAANGQAIEVDYQAHSVLASLRYNFGRKAEPAPEPVETIAPPAPPPGPPLPPPIQARPAPPPCNTGPFIVFFDWDDASITPEAAGILDSAVTAYSNCGTANVMLAGHTDRSGSVTYNMGLAERRNASVASYLGGKGIPASKITGSAFGESQPRVTTPDGVRELENRRVEVTYGPGSGM